MKAYDPHQHTKAENDNRSNQLNPNNQAYWSSRGFLLSDEDEEDERWGGRCPVPTAEGLRLRGSPDAVA